MAKPSNLQYLFLRFCFIATTSLTVAVATMARFLPQLLAMAMMAGALAKPLVTDVREHNPTAVPVTKIHMGVVSAA